MTFELRICIGSRRWVADGTRGADLSLPLNFAGSQPTFFAAPAAQSQVYEVGAFTGDVARGGSCNCSTYTLTPHCNGTHTECVGHLTREHVSVRDVAPTSPQFARLLTVERADVIERADLLGTQLSGHTALVLRRSAAMST